MTRQWLAVPEKMCDGHVLQEHAESHAILVDMEEGVDFEEEYKESMFFGAEYVKTRHDLLSALIGGHGSPMEYPSQELRNSYPLVNPTMDSLEKSLDDLFSKCPECYQNHMEKSEIE